MTINAFQKAAQQAEKLTGSTGITKLSSRQVFTGLSPIKIPITSEAWGKQDYVESLAT